MSSTGRCSDAAAVLARTAQLTTMFMDGPLATEGGTEGPLRAAVADPPGRPSYSGAMSLTTRRAERGPPRTLGELRAAGVIVRPVREEMRRNLLGVLAQRRARCCPASSASTRPVIPRSRTRCSPAITWCFLGERGQAKSRIIRGLPALLDEAIRRSSRLPAATTIRFAPICKALPPRAPRRGRRASESPGSGATQRYGEKLATPDTSIADLIGEVDPIKVAEGRYLADEETIHYGLMPRTQPRHLRHQRAARPRPRRCRSACFNLMEERTSRSKATRSACRSTCVHRRQRQPRGLHQPRPHHHAAEGPLRRPDPHPLPAHDRRTRSRSWSRRCRRSTAAAARARVPARSSRRSSRSSRFEARASQRDQPGPRA